MQASSWRDIIGEKLVLFDLNNVEDQKALLDLINTIKDELKSKGDENYKKLEEFLNFAHSNPTWIDPENINMLFQTDQPVKGPDPEFAPDFAEKYLTDLVEMTEWVSTKAMEDKPDYEEIGRKIKRFVHTMKGDAGSVGFTQIEKSCHNIESALQNFSDHELIDSFLDFAKFCLDVIQKWFSENLWLEDVWDVNRCKVENRASTTAADEGIDFSVFGDSVNVNLLKELLNDPEYSDLVKKELEKSKQQERAEPEDPAPKDPETSPISDNQFSPYSLEGDPDLYVEFTLEAEDHLSNVEKTLMEDPEAKVDLIFRCVHSIKGASGFFKLKELQEISHLLENLLDDVRNKKRAFSENLKVCLASYIDISRVLLEIGKQFWKTGNPIEWSQDGIDLLRKLERIMMGKEDGITNEPSSNFESKPEQKKEQTKEGERPFVKVDTVRLDHLIDSIGEMCIYTNMLVRQARTHLKDNIEVLDVTHQVEKFARELQGVGIALRLMPVKGLFQKMARLVWDLAKKTGKQIKFEMYGEETEMDRNIIEKLTDPLLHMVRNCVDHGIELPDDRIKAGKPKEGRISLEANHKGGTIQIVLKDDGRGLDPDKIFNKAVEKGLISKDQKLTKEEIYSLIFMPGFSTAEQVTELSGRGVGMDVVFRNVSDLRGRILIESDKGKGTSFTIELPLTLAILDGIMVSVRDEVYLIPTLSVIEIVDANNDIFLTNERGLTFNFRGQYLALYDAAELFSCPTRSEISTQNYSTKKVLVLETGSDRFALLVDEVLESFTTVIKSIDKYVGTRKGISGCSVMSDGSVALIIDVRELIDLAKRQQRVSKATSSNHQTC